MHAPITHFQMFFGPGRGAPGFHDARPKILGLQGRMVRLGGMDGDPAGAEGFQRPAG